jgi:hypothetical protein
MGRNCQLATGAVFIFRQSRYATVTSMIVQIAQNANAGLMKYRTNARARFARDMETTRGITHFIFFINPNKDAM